MFRGITDLRAVAFSACALASTDQIHWIAQHSNSAAETLFRLLLVIGYGFFGLVILFRGTE